MRDKEMIRRGFETLRERAREEDVPLCKFIAVAKRDALGAIKNERATIEEVRDTTDVALRQDLDVSTFCQIMGARIAAEWAAGTRDTL